MARITARRTLLTGTALAVAGVLIIGCSTQNSSSSASGSALAQATSPGPAAQSPPASDASTGQLPSSAPTPATSFTRVPWQQMSQGAFFSPSRNISCEIIYGGAGAGADRASCQVASNNLLVSMDVSGNYTSCTETDPKCVGGWNPEGIRTLAYGTETGVGPFLCESATTGITCTVTNGKGFQVSRSGVTPVSG
jgi:hypothetical protein